MATYGYDQYGTGTYGPSTPTGPYPGSPSVLPVVNSAYILPAFTAAPQDYESILVQWQSLPPATIATVTEFRLLSNPWGFPVDQNDGTILLDVTGAPPSPGTQWLDTTASPGKVAYYGIYVLSGATWLRAGLTACLLPRYYGYDVKLMSDLPVYFQDQAPNAIAVDVDVPSPGVPSSGGSVTSPYSYSVNVWLSSPANVMVNGVAQGTQTFFVLPPRGTVTMSYTGTVTWQWISPANNAENTTLADFLKVLGMGLDIVKSQYDMKFVSLNDPMTMSLGDLQGLCSEIGLPFNAEMPAYTMRKAALNWAHVMEQRGTLSGIAEHISLITGYAADVQVSRNMLLDDDSANPVSLIYPAWSSGEKYVIGDLVTYPTAQEWSVASTYGVGAVVMYNDLLYTCTAPVTQQPPTNVSFWAQNVSGPYVYYCLANVTTLPGTAPSGSLSANGTWSAVYGGNQNGSEAVYNMNISGLSGNAGVWEYLESNGTALSEAVGIGFPIPQTWIQGVSTPVTGPNAFGHTFRALNNSVSTQANTWLRSVCRGPADVTAGRVVPDPQLVVEHAVPLPSGMAPWSGTKKYFTNDIVTYGNCNYIALRESTGVSPPVAGGILDSNWDFENSISPWAVTATPTGTTLTAAQSTAQAYHGTHSMLLTYSGTSGAYTASAAGIVSSEDIPAIPLATYKLSTLVFGDVSGSRVAMAATFKDAFGATISTAVGSTVTLTASTWTALSQTVTAPANTATIAITPNMLAPTPNTTTFTFHFYYDVTKVTAVATPEWGRLGDDSRLPVTMSGYAIADLGFNPTVSTGVTPFAEWYDGWGNLITRVFARSTSTSGGYPSNYQYDGFDTGAGAPVAGRVPVNPSSVWSVPVGEWTVSYNGIAYAGTSAADAIGVVTSPAAGLSAATVTTAAPAGDDCGPVFWYSNTSNFWMAGLLQLYYVASATTRTVAYTGTLPAAGDRIIVQYNNTTSTTTLPNSTTVIGPSVIVYKNTVSTANQLLVVGSGGTASQTAMSSLTTPSLPGTGATSSNSGIGSIVV